MIVGGFGRLRARGTPGAVALTTTLDEIDRVAGTAYRLAAVRPDHVPGCTPAGGGCPYGFRQLAARGWGPGTCRVLRRHAETGREPFARVLM
jgi:hypothetical protein